MIVDKILNLQTIDWTDGVGLFLYKNIYKSDTLLSPYTNWIRQRVEAILLIGIDKVTSIFLRA